MELICGGGYNLEKAAAEAETAWISDPVHPSGPRYAKMALNLLEAMAPSGKVVRGSEQGSCKRKRSDSESMPSEDGGAGNREPPREPGLSRRGGNHQSYPWLPHQQFHHASPRGRGGNSNYYMNGNASGGARGYGYGGGCFPWGRGGWRT